MALYGGGLAISRATNTVFIAGNIAAAELWLRLLHCRLPRVSWLLFSPAQARSRAFEILA